MPRSWSLETRRRWRTPGDLAPYVTYGMTNNLPDYGYTTTDTAAFLTQQALMGGDMCHGRRTFNSGFVTSYASGAAAADPANGLTSNWSFRAPSGDDVDGVIAGTYDTQLQTLGATIPDGTVVSSYQEPEASVYAALFKGANLGKFVDYSQALHDQLKAGNPDIVFAYVAMGYQWGTALGNVWADWYPGDAYCDALMVDVYTMEGDTLVGMEARPDFMRWYGYAEPTGKVLGLAEYGHTWGTQNGGPGRTDGAVAPVLDDDLEWLAQHGFEWVMYWNCMNIDAGTLDGKREWAISGSAALGDNRPLSRQTWLRKLDRYGKA